MKVQHQKLTANSFTDLFEHKEQVTWIFSFQIPLELCHLWKIQDIIYYYFLYIYIYTLNLQTVLFCPYRMKYIYIYIHTHIIIIIIIIIIIE